MLLGAGPSGPSGGGFTPADVPGLVLWLDASLGTYQSTGGSPALADGDPVGEWQDQSGEGNDATQATGANKPTLKTGGNGLNGLPVIQFDGSDYFGFGDFLSALTAGEVFVVVKANADPPPSLGYNLWDLGDEGANRESWYPFQDGVIYEGWGTSVRKTVGNPTPALDSWRLYGVASGAGAYAVRLDGAEIYSTSSNTPFWPTTPQLGRGSSDTYYFAGQVAALLIYDSVLLGADREAVEDYLAARYGL